MNLGPELFVKRNDDWYAVQDLFWEATVSSNYWLRMIGVRLENLEESDLDLDLPKPVWKEVQRIMEGYRNSQGVTCIFRIKTDEIGPRELELETVIEKPTIPNLQTKWKWVL